MVYTSQMKPWFYYIFIFLYFFTVSAWAQSPGDIVADSFEETAGSGLVIRTNPAGARVFINGVEQGLTPANFNSLAPGEYNIRLVKENYLDRTFNVTLFPSSRLTASIKMEQPQGTVQLSIKKIDNETAGNSAMPFNPQVSVSSFGNVPLDDDYKAELNLPAGYYTFRVQAFGWEDASIAVLVTEDVIPVNIDMNPAEFRIANLTQSRKSFNPLNKNANRLNSIEYRFEVTAPGTGLFNVIDNKDAVVFSKQLDNFDARLQQFTWNGKDSSENPLPEGIYTVSIQAENNEIKIQTEIDYSLELFPLSSFIPMPYTLPAGSFQIESAIGYVNFDSSTSIPFTFGFRISPINNLETALNFIINPQTNDANWGITGSVKYNFIKNKSPVTFALGVSYSYLSDNEDGVYIHLPVSFKIASGSLIFTPEIFLHGLDKSDEFNPALLLSAGYFLRYEKIQAGLSAKAEIDLKNNTKPRYFACAETQIFPVSSGFYFSLQAGICTQDSRIGGFGSAGLGVVY